MDRLNMESKDIVLSNIEKIKKLFPNVVIEDKGTEVIDFETLKQELSEVVLDEKKEKYQLTWPGKREAMVTANVPTKNTLRPSIEKSVDFENTENLYIEGDNLETLKLLQESYLNKIKFIYIDPPYNTGNDFIYNDKFKISSDEELLSSGQIDEDGNRMISNTQSNGRFHSDWLSMMYPRLKLARNLMTKDGVVFISIDENELFNCKKICDEIFGENNYITTFTVENNPKGRKNSKFVAVSCEYCIAYAKDINESYFVENIPKDSSEMKEDEDGNFVHNSGKRVVVGENFFNNIVANTSSEKHYSVYFNPNEKNMIIKKENNIKEQDNDLINKGYSRFISYRNNEFVENTYTMSKLKEMFCNNELEFKQDKIYAKNMNTTIRIKNLLTNKKYKGIVNNNVVDVCLDYKTTSAGTYLKELFDGDLLFSAPKNVGLLKTLLTLISDNEFIALDFFSGSGTTADAVMQLNSELGKNVKYIMVQVPEKCDVKSDAYKAGYSNITEIAQERIKRAADRIKNETNANIDYGFRTYYLDSSNMKDIYYKPSDVSQLNLLDYMTNIKEDRTSEDLLTQVMLDLGLTLDLKIEEKNILNNKVYFVENNSLIACFDDKIDINIVDEICKSNPLKVVFKDSSFKSDKDKINLEEKIKKLSPDTEVSVL